MAKSGFVTVGTVVKVHGLKGELCIAGDADSPFLLQYVGRVYLKVEGRHPRKFEVQRSRPHSKGVLVSLQSLHSREAGRAWMGAEVWARRRDLPLEFQDRVFAPDLEGWTVYCRPEQPLGWIASVSTQTGQELWTIETEQGREVLLPAVQEFVQEVNVEEQWVRIQPPPGLLSLYGVDGEHS